MAVASYDLLAELSEYVGFTDRDAAVLAQVGPLLEPDFDGIVDSFYEAIEKNQKARAVFEDDAQIARQKVFLHDWMRGVFGGRYDEQYFELRARIGRVHVRISLDQRYMFAAMNLVRTHLHRSLAERLPAAGYDAARCGEASAAVDRILDLELAIMLETYAEDYVRRMRSAERLATLGQLAASIGHELRNPLAVMETSLHLLRRATKDDPKAVRHSDRIGAQVELCGEIITDLLDLARDRAIDRAPVSPRVLVEQAVSNLPEPAVPIVVRVADGLPMVELDGGQVRQLLSNLLSNAIEATRGHGSQVVVTAEVTDEVLVLRVDDEGQGITDAVRDRLFEPLFTTRAKGIGLGLALCHRIVEKHGGSISAENLAGGGARFEVRLPRRAKEAK